MVISHSYVSLTEGRWKGLEVQAKWGQMGKDIPIENHGLTV